LYQLERLHTDGLTWHTEHEYPACSGSDAWQEYVARYNWYEHEWDGSQYPEYVGGPIPRTSSVQRQQFGAREYSSHAVICTCNLSPGPHEYNSMTAEEDIDNDGHTEPVAYKFPLLNIVGGAVFVSRSDPQQTRGTENVRLLVHPDGGARGTTGCIGIVAENGQTNCKDVRTTLLSVAGDSRWHSWHWVKPTTNAKNWYKGIPLWVAGDQVDLQEVEQKEGVEGWLSDSVWKVVNP